MKIPKNATERKAAIDAAALSLVLSIIPAKGYCPGMIGKRFADSIIKTIENNTELKASGVDVDLGNECVEMIISAAMARLNEHYESGK